ncbi:hypothetical protein BaRGS_00015792 [Batillaria attramentaria]|uniref:Uncharacterized protein n=1 Tax=Batillaria attramentaria TaxID=370345 RepID=A0ABD0L1W9_9CAEN
MWQRIRCEQKTKTEASACLLGESSKRISIDRRAPCGGEVTVINSWTVRWDRFGEHLSECSEQYRQISTHQRQLFPNCCTRSSLSLSPPPHTPSVVAVIEAHVFRES